MSQRINSRDSLGPFSFFDPYDSQKTQQMWARFAPGEIALARNFELALTPVFIEYGPSRLPGVLL